MKTLIGKIVSARMNKTVVVEVKRQKIHPLYKKLIRRTNRLKVHNEDDTLKMGDMVKITTTKPLSKDKHYKIAGKI